MRFGENLWKSGPGLLMTHFVQKAGKQRHVGELTWTPHTHSNCCTFEFAVSSPLTLDYFAVCTIFHPDLVPWENTHELCVGCRFREKCLSRITCILLPKYGYKYQYTKIQIQMCDLVPWKTLATCVCVGCSFWGKCTSRLDDVHLVTKMQIQIVIHINTRIQVCDLVFWSCVWVAVFWRSVSSGWSASCLLPLRGHWTLQFSLKIPPKHLKYH